MGSVKSSVSLLWKKPSGEVELQRAASEGNENWRVLSFLQLEEFRDGKRDHTLYWYNPYLVSYNIWLF